jgi:hypothetical protein
LTGINPPLLDVAVSIWDNRTLLFNPLSGYRVILRVKLDAEIRTA